MSQRSDRPRTISESLACEIAGLSPPKRRQWVERGTLDQPARDVQLTELQVVELAVLRELHDVFGPRDAAALWGELHEPLREHLLQPTIDIVVDTGYREVALATSDTALARHVRTGRPIRVLSVGALVQRCRDAFRRMSADAPRQPSSRTGQETHEGSSKRTS
jgi:hypothetical protein